MIRLNMLGTLFLTIRLFINKSMVINQPSNHIFTRRRLLEPKTDNLGLKKPKLGHITDKLRVHCLEK